MSKTYFGSCIFIVLENPPDPTEARRYLGVRTFIRAPRDARECTVEGSFFATSHLPRMHRSSSTARIPCRCVVMRHGDMQQCKNTPRHTGFLNISGSSDESPRPQKSGPWDHPMPEWGGVLGPYWARTRTV